MPIGAVKTPEQEGWWNKAKSIVAKQKSKPEGSFRDRDWGLTMHIFQGIKKKRLGEDTYDDAFDRINTESDKDFEKHKKKLDDDTEKRKQKIKDKMKKDLGETNMYISEAYLNAFKQMTEGDDGITKRVFFVDPGEYTPPASDLINTGILRAKKPNDDDIGNVAQQDNSGWDDEEDHDSTEEDLFRTM